MSEENLPVRQQTDLFSGRAYPLVPLETGRHSIIRLPEKGQELATRDDTTGEGSTKIGNINGQNTIKVENHVHHHAAPVINVLVQTSERSHREEHLPRVIVLGGLNHEPERAPVRYSSRPEHHAESWFGQLAFLLIAFMGLMTLFAVIVLGLKSSSTPTVVVAPTAVPARPEPGGFDDFMNSSSR